VSNTGVSAFNGVTVDPVTPSSAATNSGPQNIAAGATATFTLTYTVADPSQDFPVTVSVNYQGQLPSQTQSTSCPKLILPSLTVSKTCAAEFRAGDSTVAGLHIRITSQGTVVNTGNVDLTSIVITDSRVDGPGTVTSPATLVDSSNNPLTTLAKGATGHWSTTYIPMNLNSQTTDPTACLKFADTVSVTATSTVENIQASATNSASCSPCFSCGA